MRNTNKILVEKPEGNRRFGIPGRNGNRKTGCGLHSRQGPVSGSCEYGSEYLSFVKGGKFLLDASKEIGLEVNSEKTKYMFVSRHQTAGQSNYIK
jgi:hypothetical protein